MILIKNAFRFLFNKIIHVVWIYRIHRRKNPASSTAVFQNSTWLMS